MSAPTTEHQQLKESAYKLAMFGLQSERYSSDPEYRDEVDNVLALTKDVLPDLIHSDFAKLRAEAERAEWEAF